MTKPKIFTNKNKSSFMLWWFTNYNKIDERLHSKEFKTLNEAEQYKLKLNENKNTNKPKQRFIQS